MADDLLMVRRGKLWEYVNICFMSEWLWNEHFLTEKPVAYKHVFEYSEHCVEFFLFLHVTGCLFSYYNPQFFYDCLTAYFNNPVAIKNTSERVYSHFSRGNKQIRTSCQLKLEWRMQLLTTSFRSVSVLFELLIRWDWCHRKSSEKSGKNTVKWAI